MCATTLHNQKDPLSSRFLYFGQIPTRLNPEGLNSLDLGSSSRSRSRRVSHFLFSVKEMIFQHASGADGTGRGWTRTRHHDFPLPALIETSGGWCHTSEAFMIPSLQYIA